MNEQINYNEQNEEKNFLQKRIDQLGLSVRSSNCLASANIVFIEDLVRKSSAELLSIKNFGRTSLYEINKLLEQHGLRLNMPEKRDANKAPPEIIERYPHQDDNSIPESLQELAFPLNLLKRVETLGLSVRAMNYLRTKKVTYIGDLVHLHERDLFYSKNLGRRTIEEIRTKLAPLNLSLDLTFFYWPPDNLIKISSEYDKYLAEKSTETLKESFDRTLEKLSNPQHAYIIRSRIGVDKDPGTLEEIGQELGITRERVRQIQKKQTRLILEKEFWDDVLRIKLRSLLKNRKTPLFFDELSNENDWFSGFEGSPTTFKNIVSSFCNEETYHFLKLQNKIVITRISQEEWISTKYDLLGMLESTINCNHSLEDIELFISSKLAKLNSNELTDIFLDEISCDLNFAAVDDDMVLVSVGNSLSSHLHKLLEEAGEPLHYKEIAKKYIEAFGIDVSVRYVHSCLVGNEFLLFNRGTYGLKKHLKASRETQNTIIKTLEEEIEKKTHTRQWHASNLLKIVSAHLPKKDKEKINKYIINIVLHASQKLMYLGKSMWKYKVEGDELTERLHIKKAVYKVLKQAGEPLHIDDLHQRVSQLRGTGEFFSINLSANNLYSRVDPATWGLLDRDFSLSLNEWENIKSLIEQYLQNQEQALHKSEVLKKIISSGFSSNLTEGQVFGVFLADERFKTWKGRYIGLANWKTSGWKSVQEVMKLITNNLNSPTTTDEIINQAYGLLGYHFNKRGIGLHLNSRT